MHIFKKLARYFETRYWYHSRKITTLYFNEDSQKFENSFPKEHAKDILSSYWNGEADLWQMMLLKLENMFWALHKNGSDLVLTYKTDKEIPQKSIPKSKKLYEIKTFEDENGKLQFEKKESPQYELKSEMTVIDFGKVEVENLAEKILSEVSAQFEEKINVYLKSHPEINVDKTDLLPLEKLVLKNCHECGGFEIAEIPNFSENLKEHATGNFIKCKQLLHLRHLAKKLLSAVDNLFTEESVQTRQDLYKKIFEFMNENGMKWWD